MGLVGVDKGKGLVFVLGNGGLNYFKDFIAEKN
jgi:hypothetical protein